jgi:hypothetical protein
MGFLQVLGEYVSYEDLVPKHLDRHQEDRDGGSTLITSRPVVVAQEPWVLK